MSELGEPLTYKALGPDAVPLSRATHWPDDMDPRTAEHFAEALEAKVSLLIGAQPCPHTHATWINPDECPGCGAAV